MTIHCPQCRSKVLADDLNMQALAGMCRSCHAVFSILDQLPAGDPVREAAPAARAEVPMPGKFKLERAGSDFVIVWDWKTPAMWFLVLFCIFWDGFLLFWYSMAFGTDSPLIVKIFPLIHVAVGLGLTYFVVCMFVNRTFVGVAGGNLTVTHTPLPWPGNRVMPAADIEQLYCFERVHRGKNGTSITYEVNAVDRGGRKVKLVGGLQEAEQALFLEQEIERALGIADRRVPGELRK